MQENRQYFKTVWEFKRSSLFKDLYVIKKKKTGYHWAIGDHESTLKYCENAEESKCELSRLLNFDYLMTKVEEQIENNIFENSTEKVFKLLYKPMMVNLGCPCDYIWN